MDEDFQKLVDQLPLLLQTLLSSSPLEKGAVPARAGVYVLFEKDTPLYVGRTRNLKQRLNSHYDITNPNKGSFAFLMACETFGRKKASYKKQGSRKELHRDPVFRAKHFIPANERLKLMQVKFIDIQDPKVQHLFEIYAATVLKTDRYNCFDTH